MKYSERIDYLKKLFDSKLNKASGLQPSFKTPCSACKLVGLTMWSLFGNNSRPANSSLLLKNSLGITTMWLRSK